MFNEFPKYKYQGSKAVLINSEAEEAELGDGYTDAPSDDPIVAEVDPRDAEIEALQAQVADLTAQLSDVQSKGGKSKG